MFHFHLSTLSGFNLSSLIAIFYSLLLGTVTAISFLISSSLAWPDPYFQLDTPPPPHHPTPSWHNLSEPPEPIPDQLESQNSEHGCIKDQWPYLKQDKDPKPQPGTPSILQSPKSGLKDMDVLCTFKIKIENKNLEHGYFKDLLPYTNQD